MSGEKGEYGHRERARSMRWVAVGIFAVLLGRLLYLETYEADRYAALSETNRARLVRARAPRGLLLDREGRLLAGNRASVSLFMSVADASRHREAMASVAALSGRSESILWGPLERARGSRFEPICLLRDIPFDVLSRLEEQNFTVPGTSLEIEPIRFYPWGRMGAQLLGTLGEVNEDEIERIRWARYHSGDYRGRTGIERLCEAQLRGRDGGRFVEVNAMGKEVRPLPERSPIVPRDGNRVVLALDLKLEERAQAALEEAGNGAVVALDPRNGDILAMVSSPSFDPNIFGGGVTASEWRMLNEDPGRPLINRAVAGLYPPGSTFKVAVASMALESGRIRPDELLRPCTGSYRFGSRAFRCWKAGGHGSLPITQAIAQSCDIYFYQLGQRVGLELMADFAGRWNLNEPTGSGLAEEVGGNFPSPEWMDRRYGPRGWSRAVELNAAIGQGEVLVTPLSLATLVAGIANGSEMMVPRVWLRFESPTGQVLKVNEPKSTPLGLSPSTVALVRQGMALAVAHGTARAASLPGINVGGKTGTAQNPHGEDHAWFVGFAPVEDPEIVVLALVEQGGHGGAVAAPVVAKVMATYFGLGQDSAAAPEM